MATILIHRGAGGGGSGSDANYVHDQQVASAAWSVVHNLGKFPSVTVVDSAGSVVVGDPLYVSANSLSIFFTAPFAGKAYLN